MDTALVVARRAGNPAVAQALCAPAAVLQEGEGLDLLGREGADARGGGGIVG